MSVYGLGGNLQCLCTDLEATCSVRVRIWGQLVVSVYGLGGNL